MRITFKNILSVSVFLILGVSAFSQVPGYLGKKFHIQAGINFFPQFGNYPVNVVQPLQLYAVSGMNYRAGLELSYVVSRKSSIGIHGEYLSTAARHGFYDYDQDARFAIDAAMVGVVFKTHFGPWIAPLGPYFKAEGGVLLSVISDPLNRFAPDNISQTLPNGYISAGIGRTHIFANVISLDYGGQMGFVFPPYGYASFIENTNTRLAVHYAASFYVKLGVVI